MGPRPRQGQIRHHYIISKCVRRVSIFLTKNNYKEVVCEFKNHRVGGGILGYIKDHPKEAKNTKCEFGTPPSPDSNMDYYSVPDVE
ncbi:hypothetical protein CENSYa_2022 [Cenarchaeum symbiosum A]|uniref:Uncharacterized protein n=1 Tax=Cenarchaeum symbiosum (strain A) TaxID=414004 RepID=A0RZ59_CENSY|nr:hypothetical protein CENSYa_2022 [Cenarchaeum symbiosum A]